MEDEFAIHQRSFRNEEQAIARRRDELLGELIQERNHAIVQRQ